MASDDELHMEYLGGFAGFQFQGRSHMLAPSGTSRGSVTGQILRGRSSENLWGAGMVERGIAVVVEDDDDVRESLKQVLQQSGFSVFATSSGTEGVETVREHDPVIVTMDVGLPDFDGIEAARRIRTFSDAYLIIVSGRVEEADALMGFEAGADDYLTKPFRPRELRAR